MKFTTTAFLSLFFYLSLSAQNVKWGINAGFFYGKFHIASDQIPIQNNGEWGRGFVAGFRAVIKPENTFNIETGLEFIMKPLSSKGNVFYSQNNVSYIQLPVLGRYNVSEKIHLVAGPSIGYMLDSDTKLEKIAINGYGGLGFSVVENRTVRLLGGYGLNNLLLEESGADVANGRFFDIHLSLIGSF